MKKSISFLLVILLSSMFALTISPYPVKGENITTYGCNDTWYVFDELSCSDPFDGAPIKASSDFDTTNTTGGTVEVSMSCTSTARLSVVLEYKAKEFLKTAISVDWVSSATFTQKVSYGIDKGKRGYMVFIPKYRKVTGNLKLYAACGEGLISSKYVEIYIPVKSASGMAEGTYRVVYY